MSGCGDCAQVGICLCVTTVFTDGDMSVTTVFTDGDMSVCDDCVFKWGYV